MAASERGSGYVFKVPSGLQSWLSSSSSQWAAAGPADLSLTHLRAASRLEGWWGCVRRWDKYRFPWWRGLSRLPRTAHTHSQMNMWRSRQEGDAVFTHFLLDVLQKYQRNWFNLIENWFIDVFCCVVVRLLCFSQLLLLFLSQRYGVHAHFENSSAPLSVI